MLFIIVWLTHRDMWMATGSCVKDYRYFNLFYVELKNETAMLTDMVLPQFCRFVNYFASLTHTLLLLFFLWLQGFEMGEGGVALCSLVVLSSSGRHSGQWAPPIPAVLSLSLVGFVDCPAFRTSEEETGVWRISWCPGLGNSSESLLSPLYVTSSLVPQCGPQSLSSTANYVLESTHTSYRLYF